MQRLTNGIALCNVPWSSSRSLASFATQRLRPFTSIQQISKRPASSLNFRDLDSKWQKVWEEKQRSRRYNGEEKEYVLAMFPYPSGALHMGHVRVYTIADVLARFKRMQGNGNSKDVMYPMGWDAFGLPAENAAIERGLDPAQWTKANIAKMKEQLQAMNTDMDWSRELVTCNPDFYKHTQRLFLLLYQHGMAYQAESLVNYDPIDRTVLANEQVDSNGFSWRSGAKVEKVSLKQWFFRITDFKEQLLDDLKLLKKWPERVTAMQRNWLGKSTGTKLSFGVTSEIKGSPSSISVFTTRLDTLFGVQFLALSPAHPLVVEHAKQDQKLAAFIQALPDLPEGSKAGYQIKGLFASNPLARIPRTPAFVQEPLSVWVAPYVKSDYAEGAVMGVPAHDERDFEFWKTNCASKPIRSVIEKPAVQNAVDSVVPEVFAEIGQLRSACPPYAGLTSEQASERIIEDLKAAMVPVESVDTWRLRDWLISRQRYWGAPIPIIHCHSCGPVPVPAQDLPVELPALDPDVFKSRTGNPLDKAEQWLNVPCPKCKRPAKRDTDTMDTFVDSSWYMFRFADPHNECLPFDEMKANQYMPVSTYVGGIEHAILHLLYARFIGKFLSKIGMWPGGASVNVRGEPFSQLISQGMVHGKTFSDPGTGKFLKPEEVDMTQPLKPLIKALQKEPNVTFEKMSKSKYNGVDPTEVIARYGADVTRVHILFQAPVSEVLEWEEARIVGVQRWLARLYKHVERAALLLEDAKVLNTGSAASPNNHCEDIDITALSPHQVQLYLKTQQTVASITNALADTHSLNTCISDLMTLTNDITSIQKSIPEHLLYYVTSTVIRLVGPFAPAFAEETWEILHSKVPDSRHSLFEHTWPEAGDLSKLEDWAKQNLKQPCAIMENGKLRMVLDFDPVPEELAEEKKQAWALEQMQKDKSGMEWLNRKEASGGWTKIIVVKGGKTINFVGRASK